MKKTIVILMTAIICSLIFAGSAAASSQGGLHDGEYLIYDAADMQAFAAAVNGGQTTLNAKLMADIDLSGIVFVGIGTTSMQYDGVFDGDGHTVSGFGVRLINGKRYCIVKNTRFLDFTFDGALGILFNAHATNCIFDGGGVTRSQASNTQNNLLFGCIADNCIFTNFVLTGGNAVNLVNGYSDYADYAAKSCIFYDIKLTSSGTGQSSSAIPVLTYKTASDCIAIDGYRNGNAGPIAQYARIGSAPSYTVANNNYASESITSNRGEYTNTGKNTVNGQTVTATQYNQKGFYDGTGIGGVTYLNWDFVNTWYWDITDNLPKLQVFRQGVQISSVTVTSSDLAAAGHNYINATVTATSSMGTLSYQWYRSTNAGTTWTIIPGQTTAALSFIPTAVARNFLKVVVSDGTSTVDSYSDAGFTDVYVRVLHAYDPLPVVAKPSSIQAKTSEPYQATQEFDFDISATIYDVAWLGNDTAYVAAGNAIYAISGYMAEVMPVSDWTGNTIRKAYIGTNRGIIEDVSSNVAVYDYKTRSAQYISHDGADHVAVTANYAAIVKDNTLYVYDKNNRLIGSIATGSIKSIYGNDKLDIFTSVSTAGYKPITVYSISGSTIVKTDLDNYNSPDILPIRYTDNYILTYNNGVDHVNIIKTTASALTTVYGTQAGKYTSMQATVNNALIGAKQNTVEIRGVNGALVGTYDTGGNINDVSISRDTGLFAIVGGEDNQAYFLNKYESSNWVLGQKVNFRETVYKSQISTDGTFAVVGTTNKLFLWKYTEIIESTFFINGVVIGSDGLAYANKAITIDTDTVITDDSGFFVYPVRPGQTYTITAGSQTTRYTATNQALQTLSIRIQSQLIAQDVTYSAVYNAETGKIEMSYADSGAKTTSVTWKIRDTHSGQTVYQQTGESGSFFVPTDKQSSNYFVSVEADRQNTVVKNTWSITPSGVGQEVNLFGLDDTGKNILFGFFLIVLAGLFGYLHQHIGTIIIAFTAAVLRYLGLITIPWIMIIIAVVVAIVAAIANRSAGK